jgi:hypothetical protein
MKGKAAETKEFDKVLRGVLTAKPLSVAEISARIHARRKARQKDKQAGRTTRLQG